MGKARNILLTGVPGCGKSTVVENLLGRLGVPATGFFTREIRRQGRRVGFSLETLGGRQAVLAHHAFSGPHRVGKYGVDLARLEEIALPALQPPTPGHLVVIDEIGRMECLSALFQEAVKKALDGPNPVLATIALRGSPFMESIKARRDVRLLEITPENRAGRLSECLAMLAEISHG